MRTSRRSRSLAAEYVHLVEALGREPNRLELGIVGALWSEHCSYKTSKPLLGTLPTKGPRVLQGPGENAGAVDIGEGLACVFKIESHNHPSAIEPYQGAATGVGGILRDIFTMGARPVALLDSLRFGPLDEPHQRHLFDGVVAGVGGYGNCIGVPTVGGELYFDELYRTNCLVNAMCVGVVEQGKLTPRNRERSRQSGSARRGRHWSRRHSRRELCVGRARCRQQCAAARCAGGQPISREMSDGGVSRARR